MVKETRIIFDLADIVSIRFVCVQCSGEVVHYLDNAVRQLPKQCPVCNASWDGASGISLAEEMREVLRKAKEWNQQGMEFRVCTRLELKDD